MAMLNNQMVDNNILRYTVLWYVNIYQYIWLIPPYTIMYYDLYYDTITIYYLLCTMDMYIFIFLWGTWSTNWFGKLHFAQNRLNQHQIEIIISGNYSKIGPCIWDCLQLDSGMFICWFELLRLFSFQHVCAFLGSEKFPWVFLLDQ